MGDAADSPVYRCTICHAVYTAGERFCPLDAGPIAPDGDTDPRIGRTIDGRYFVRRLIGRGGMGTVYEADHVGLDKRVAIKFLAINKTDRDALARFRREAKIASRIVHQHVVQIFDVGTADADTDFIVMELVAGRDLAAVLRESKMLEPGRTVAIACQVLRGLRAIHQAGIVHRDIKPANILLSPRDDDPDFVKIMDFGISRPIHGETITNTGAIIGTPEYMAPEQLLAEDIGPRADLYAVGVMMYRMLTGTLPFTTDVFDRSAAANPYVEVPPVDTVRPDIPSELSRAIAKAVAKPPDDRYADAQAFLHALEPLGRSFVGAGATAVLSGPNPPSQVSGLERTVSAPSKVSGLERTVSALAAADTAYASSQEAPPEPARSSVTAPARPSAGIVAQPAVTIPDRQPRGRSRAPLIAGIGLAVAGIAIAAIVLVSRGNGDREIATAPPEPAVPSTRPTPPTPPDPPTKGSAAGTPASTPSQGDKAAGLLAKARAAERAGKLDDAIAAYGDAYALDPAADTSFQIAELHERLGHDADAITWFQRYLHLAKNASDHDVVVDRIARLERAVNPPKTSNTVARHVDTAPLERCHCIPIDGPDTQSLCKNKGPSLCKCKHHDGRDLCPTQVTRCPACPDPDKRCDADGCSSDGWSCGDKLFQTTHVPAKHGDPCTGYETYDLLPASHGTWYCDVCSGPHPPRQFVGHHGDKCFGYYRHTGQRMEGRLWCHRD